MTTSPVIEVEKAPDRRRGGPRFYGNIMQVLEVTSDLVCICLEGRISQINTAGFHMLGAESADEIKGRAFQEFLADDFAEVFDDFLVSMYGETEPFPCKLVGLDGSDVNVTVTVFRARELGPEGVVVLVKDITHEHWLSTMAYQGLQRSRMLLENSVNLICACRDKEVTFINGAGVAMLGGADASDFIGRPLSELFHDDYRAVFEDGAAYLVSEGMLPARLQRRDGEVLDAEVTVTAFDGDADEDAEYMLEARDITAHNLAVHELHKINTELEDRVQERTKALEREVEIRRKAENRLREAATHDGLTGLPNRGLLMDRLNTAIHRAHRNDDLLALLFLDLDGFKEINDTRGHDAGDIVLQEISRRLDNAVRETDTVARMGGDEFVVLLTDVAGRDCVYDIASKVLEVVSHPVHLEPNEAVVGVSIGVAMYPMDGTSSKELLMQSDQAMYDVKRKGKNSIVFAGDVD